MFMLTLTAGATLLLAYVLARGATVPLIARRVSPAAVAAIGIALWLILFLSLYLGHGASGDAARILEQLGMTLLAGLFLIAVAVLLVDLVTAFGLLFRRHAPTIRGWAFVAGGALALLAMVQGLRPPVVSRYEMSLAGLPADLDGTVLVALSDLHLGSTLGERWLGSRLEQVRSLDPDMVVFLGDVFEGHGRPADAVLQDLRALSAPLGVWAVTGNHEFHHRRAAGPGFLEEAGLRVLHDRWAMVRPGLVLAGVDDLTSRRRGASQGDAVTAALAGRPPGAAMLLSHTPWDAHRAAAAGVGLMLSGHTHGGQIWPFGLLVRRVYPLLAGRYQVDGMPVIVSRGTGTWGPRMRLWAPGEILCITLRSRTTETRDPAR